MKEETSGEALFCLQVNYDMMDAALDAIQSFVPDGSKVWKSTSDCLSIVLHLITVCLYSVGCDDVMHGCAQVVDIHAGVGVIGEQFSLSRYQFTLPHAA